MGGVTQQPEADDDIPDISRFKAWFRRDREHSSKWRTAARDDFAFLAGEQWTPEEEAFLTKQQRVPITFNRCLSILKAIAGSEINSRQEIRFIGRTMDDAKVNEVLTGASKYFADESDAEDEESEAFQDSLVCGMGWTEQRIDFDMDPQGAYVEDHIDPLEMYWDHNARKKNIVDARRVWRAKSVPLGEARDQFPGFDDADLDATWARMDDTRADKTLEQKRERFSDNPSVDPYDDDHHVTIVECQWWEREPYYILADEGAGKIELSEEEFDLLSARAKKVGISFTSAKLMRRVYKRVFLGSVPLNEPEDIPTGNQFSYQCITGEHDRNKNVWYGLVRIMRDPQKWANKWLSQTLHIMNSSAKGGIIAEKGAFENQRQAEDTYARPEAITWVAGGTLSNPNGARIQPKPAAQFPAGFFQLMEFAISSIRDVTGINLELLGMRDATQPGILEAQRKQAAMTILATAFDSLRRFRKLVGRNRLYFIQHYLSDARLVRIVGQDGAQVVPLTKDTTTGSYDVIVDDAPASPNQKEANWMVISAMLPAVGGLLTPEMWAIILEYSPLPSDLVEKFKALMAQSQGDPAAQQKQALAMQQALAKVQRDGAAAEKDHAQAAKTQVEAARLMQTPITVPGLG
ncbi:portal protein [Xanthobacter versatilis]|uniref:portal protein n=1 Tax=Xanthobacter autotrophicus (strain ATCC BAA-1158 / Py2) TaxID=78245 RepID=UPI0037263F04